MARSRNGIIPVVFILFASLTGLCSGQERLPRALLSSGPAQQPFAASLLGCGNSVDPSSRTVCQLNAPTTESGKCQSEKRKWIVVKGGGMVATAEALSGFPECGSCESCGASACTVTTEKPAADYPVAGHPVADYPVAACSSMDQFCADVSAHLATTLIGSKDSPAAQKRVIHAALQMIAEKAQVDAESKIESVVLTEMATQPAKQPMTETAAESELLEPLIAAQYRNAQQLEALASANEKTQRSMERLENQMTQFALTQRVKFSDSEVRTMMVSAEENEQREQEIERLQMELLEIDQKLKNLQTGPVQRASYLEPVYRRDQPLKPIEFGR